MKLPAQNGPQNMILKKPLENINSMEEGILVQQLARQIEPMLIKAGYGQHQGYDAISGAAPFVAHTPAAWQGAANPTGQKGGKMQTFPEFLQDRLAEEIEPMLSKAGYFSGNSGAAGVAPIAAQAGGPMMFAQGAGVGFDMERPEMQHRLRTGLGDNGIGGILNGTIQPREREAPQETEVDVYRREAMNDLSNRTSGGLSVNGIGAILNGPPEIVERDKNYVGQFGFSTEVAREQAAIMQEQMGPPLTKEDEWLETVFNDVYENNVKKVPDKYLSVYKEKGYDIIVTQGEFYDIFEPQVADIDRRISELEEEGRVLDMQMMHASTSIRASQERTLINKEIEELKQLKSAMPIVLCDEMMKNPYIAKNAHLISLRVIDKKNLADIGQARKSLKEERQTALYNKDYGRVAAIDRADRLLLCKTPGYASFIASADELTLGLADYVSDKSYSELQGDDYAQQEAYLCSAEQVAKYHPDSFANGKYITKIASVAKDGYKLTQDIFNKGTKSDVAKTVGKEIGKTLGQKGLEHDHLIWEIFDAIGGF